MRYDLIIVGAGAAGDALVRSLEIHNYPGRVLIISCEPDLPYMRTALSKLENLDPKLISLGPYFQTEIRLGEEVKHIYQSRRSVVLADGQEIGFHRLVLATGSISITNDAILPEVMTLRTLSDRRKMQFGENHKWVVLGADPIGLEFALLAHKMGSEVTLVNEDDGIGPIPWVQDEMRHIEYWTGNQLRIYTNHGYVVDTDHILAAFGYEPDLTLAKGLGMHRGQLMLSPYLQSTNQAIYAIGDLAGAKTWYEARQMGHWLGEYLTNQTPFSYSQAHVL